MKIVVDDRYNRLHNSPQSKMNTAIGQRQLVNGPSKRVTEATGSHLGRKPISAGKGKSAVKNRTPQNSAINRRHLEMTPP
jgi:hypothetical protein